MGLSTVGLPGISSRISSLVVNMTPVNVCPSSSWEVLHPC